MTGNDYLEIKLYKLIDEQQESQGIQKYIRLAYVFDFIGTHIITIKKKYPILYSSSSERFIYFRENIFEKIYDSNTNIEDRGIYQECLTLLQGFELSLNF